MGIGNSKSTCWEPEPSDAHIRKQPRSFTIHVAFPYVTAVTGMTHSEAGAKRLRGYGVEVAISNALEVGAVEAAPYASNAEAVIDELTPTPKTPLDFPPNAARDRELRIEGRG
jgi:hypothetical protein